MDFKQRLILIVIFAVIVFVLIPKYQYRVEFTKGSPGAFRLLKMNSLTGSTMLFISDSYEDKNGEKKLLFKWFPLKDKP